jgi:hypothetical protein
MKKEKIFQVESFFHIKAKSCKEAEKIIFDWLKDSAVLTHPSPVRGWWVRNRSKNGIQVVCTNLVGRDWPLKEYKIEPAVDLPIENDEKLVKKVSKIMAERKSAMLCQHANEVPVFCDCPKDCYCKKHTCKKSPRSSPEGYKYDECHCAHGYLWAKGCKECSRQMKVRMKKANDGNKSKNETRRKR